MAGDATLVRPYGVIQGGEGRGKGESGGGENGTNGTTCVLTWGGKVVDGAAGGLRGDTEGRRQIKVGILVDGYGYGH